MPEVHSKNARAPWLSALKTNNSVQRVLLALLALGWLKALRVVTGRRTLQGCGPGDEATCVSKKVLPFLLAFVAGWYDVVCFKQYKCYANMMTGNTLNLCMKVGGGDTADASLIAAAILNFTGGFALFKYLDMKMQGRGSCMAIAPVVAALFAFADAYRRRFPQSRWHMLFLAAAGGMINSVSAERAKLVSNMMTGHFQKLSGDLADYLAKGVSNEQQASSLVSMRLVSTFCSGVCVGMAAWNVQHPFPVLARRRFAIIGSIYAVILVLHELPVDLFYRPQKSPHAKEDGDNLVE